MASPFTLDLYKILQEWMEKPAQLALPIANFHVPGALDSVGWLKFHLHHERGNTYALCYPTEGAPVRVWYDPQWRHLLRLDHLVQGEEKLAKREKLAKTSPAPSD